jgi:hypothetical protein
MDTGLELREAFFFFKKKAVKALPFIKEEEERLQPGVTNTNPATQCR